jgi:hypothetical protein
VHPKLVRKRAQISHTLLGEKLGKQTRHVRLALGGRVSAEIFWQTCEGFASCKVDEDSPCLIGRRVFAWCRAHFLTQHLAGAPLADVPHHASVLLELEASDHGCAGGQL